MDRRVWKDTPCPGKRFASRKGTRTRYALDVAAPMTDHARTCLVGKGAASDFTGCIIIRSIDLRDGLDDRDICCDSDKCSWFNLRRLGVFFERRGTDG